VVRQAMQWQQSSHTPAHPEPGAPLTACLCLRSQPLRGASGAPRSPSAPHRLRKTGGTPRSTCVRLGVGWEWEWQGVAGSGREWIIARSQQLQPIHCSATTTARCKHAAPLLLHHQRHHQPPQAAHICPPGAKNVPHALARMSAPDCTRNLTMSTSLRSGWSVGRSVGWSVG